MTNQSPLRRMHLGVLIGRLIEQRRAALFWSKVDKSGECWIWKGSLTEFGHGQVRVNYRLVRAHRYAWEIERGPIPKGMCALHRCDQPACVRPDHLFLGSKADNTADMMAKGRGRVGPVRSGEANASSKLTAAQVAEIRRRYGAGRGKGQFGPIPQHVLAKEFRVAQSLISAVVRGEAWR